MSSWLQNPGNVFSNCAYIIVGIFFLVGAPRYADPPRAQRLGYLTVALGICSSFFHTMLNNAGDWMDFFGILLVINYLLTIKVGRIAQWSTYRRRSIYIVLNAFVAIAMVVLFRWKVLFVCVAAFALMMMLITSRSKRPHRWLAACTFLVGFGLWILDVGQHYCLPFDWYNGHALWHVATAISIHWLGVYTFGQDAPLLSTSGHSHP